MLNGEPSALHSDAEINRFTKLISIFFVVLSIKGPDSTIFLAAYSELLSYFSDTDLKKIIAETAIPDSDTYLTKGGISEFVKKQISYHPEITFSELLQLIDENF